MGPPRGRHPRPRRRPRWQGHPLPRRSFRLRRRPQRHGFPGVSNLGRHGSHGTRSGERATASSSWHPDGQKDAEAGRPLGKCAAEGAAARSKRSNLVVVAGLVRCKVPTDSPRTVKSLRSPWSRGRRPGRWRDGPLRRLLSRGTSSTISWCII